MKLKLSTLGVTAGLFVAAITAGSLHAQTLIDVQIAGTYGGNSSTNAVGAAVLGSSGDIWNQYSAPFTGSFPGAQAVNTVSGASSGASFAASISGPTYVGTLPSGAANGFTAKTGAPTATVTNLFSGTTDWLNISNPSSSINTVFTFSNLTAYIGESFTYDVYYGGQGTSSSLTGATGGNSGSSLSATGADANINSGTGDAYVQYTGVINSSTLTFTATMPPTNLGGNGWGGCLVGAQLQIVPEPSTWALFGVAMACGLVFRHKLARKNA